MDGYVTEDITDKNEPICDFLRYLIAQIPDTDNGKNKAKKIRAMIRELSNVIFEPAEKAFYDYEFIPNGIRRGSGGVYRFDKTDLFQDTFHEIMIISPFLSGDILRNFNDRNTNSRIDDARYILITREMSLGRLKPEDVSRFRIYTMRDAVVEGESSISGDSQDIQKQDIHAKLYMKRKQSKSDLYLGSLNATHNAVYGNIEFMIRLRSKNLYLNIDNLKKALFGEEKDGSDNPFQEVTLQNAIFDEEDEQAKALDIVIKNISRSNPSAIVVREDEDYYSVNVHFDDCDTKDYQVNIRPLLSKRAEEFSNDVLFTRLAITELSEFYVIAVSSGEQTVERVLIIPTEGLPDDREKQVISSVISNRDCFYRYIAFLLGDDSILSILEVNSAERETHDTKNRQAYHVPALYEKMLRTAAVNPEKFQGIEYLMKTVSDDGVIPEEFTKLYETFKKVVKLRRN